MRESNAAFCNGEIKKGASRVARETTNDDASLRSRHFVNGPANTGREGFDDYCWSNNGGRNERNGNAFDRLGATLLIIAA